jgi:hypothetical protein
VGGAISLASSKHGPDYPRVLIGYRHRCAVEAAPLPKLIDPLIIKVRFGRHCSDNGPCAVDEQASEVPIPAL